MKRFRFVESVPFPTKRSVLSRKCKLVPEPSELIAPIFATSETASFPSPSMTTSPENVFAPVNDRIPEPILLSPPLPSITPAKVESVLSEPTQHSRQQWGFRLAPLASLFYCSAIAFPRSDGESAAPESRKPGKGRSENLEAVRAEIWRPSLRQIRSLR